MLLPLDEIRLLDSQIAKAAQLSELRPLYDRLAEIGQQNPDNFEIQVAVADSRRRVIERGVELRRHDTLDERLAVVPVAPAPVVHKPAAEEPPKELTPTLPGDGFKWKKWTVIVALVSTAWLGAFVGLVQLARNRNLPRQGPALPQASQPEPGTVPVDFVTIPPGASIQINGEGKCKSDCRVHLAPGNYQVTALLEGFDPGATGVTVVPGAPISVKLSLTSQTQTVRLFTDLEGGSVMLDGKPAGQLQDGQLVLDRIANGAHSIRVTGKVGEAAFTFTGESGKLPVLTAPVAATNVMAVVVTSLGELARVHSSASTATKVSLNGQAMGEAGAQGLDLKNIPAGTQTLAVGEGKEERKLVVSFGPMPTVTAYLKSDVSTGTLVVSTGEDGVTVFVNGREHKRKTRRGELRVQAVGDVSVGVSKEGFQAEPEQQVEVKKGEEVKVAFKLKPLPRMAALQIRNGVPDTQIFIEDRSLGRIAADGTLSATNLTPGEHAIEARREGFITRRILRTLKEGETTVVGGADIALSSATGTIHFVLWPPDTAVTYRRADEAQTHSTRDATIRLEPGSYTFTGRAPNFLERVERVTVVAGESRNVELALTRENHPAPVQPPAPKQAVSDWSTWRREGSDYVKRGGNRVVVRSGGIGGTINFVASLRKGGNIFRGGKVRWFLEGTDGVTQFEVDRRHFSARGPDSSRSKEHARDEADNAYAIQIEITPERIVHRMKVGSNWVVLDTQANRGVSDGKFGFTIPGGDEIAVSGLTFTPR